MTRSQDPDEYLFEAKQLRLDVAEHEEPTSDRLVMIGISDEYPGVFFVIR